MRIHSDIITADNVRAAATVARVDFARFTEHGSRKRKGAFDILLRGESRRAPNMGTARNVDRFNISDKAATWDQWGVFLGILFDTDPDMVTPYYADRYDFNFKTDARFTKIGGGWNNFWPADSHGDHTFRYSGIPYRQDCTKCSASMRWQ